jgi:plasmid stabilization system protein ParE
MAVRWSVQALEDLADINDFYTNLANEAVANQIIDGIKRDIRRLAVTPFLGSKDARLRPDAPNQYEYWYAFRTQYRVYYRRLGPRTIQVYRVWPSRRQPLEPEDIVPPEE